MLRLHRSTFAPCWSCVAQALQASLSQVFDAPAGTHCITISSSLPAGGDVSDMWAAMELLGCLSQHMQAVAGAHMQSQGAQHALCLQVLSMCLVELACGVDRSLLRSCVDSLPTGLQFGITANTATLAMHWPVVHALEAVFAMLSWPTPAACVVLC